MKKVKNKILSVVMVVVIILTIIPATVYAANDSIGTAKLISFDTNISGQISTNNKADYYSVTLNNSGRISLSLTSFMRFYCIILYNSEGHEIWNTNRNEWISTTGQRSDTHKIDLEKGTYYFQINGYRYNTYDASTGNYNFTVAFNSSGANTPNPNNNNIATAQKIEFNSNVKGQIAINDRADYYSFELLNSGRISLSFTSFMRFYCIILYSSEGHEIWYTDRNEWISTTGQRSDTHKIDLEKGTYYFQINGYRYNAYDASTGNYNFTVAFNSSGANTPNPNNNNIATAQKIEFSSNVKGQIAINDRADYYSFELLNSDRVSINITSFMRYYCINLYNSEGHEIWNTNRNEWISTTERRSDTHQIDLEKGTYYFQVNGYRYNTYDASTGNYNFTVVRGTSNTGVTDPNSIDKGVISSEGKATGKPTIFCFIEILLDLVGLESKATNNSAAILSPQGKDAGKPTIFCGIEILQYLVGLTDGKEW
ncbi:MAG: hypothetical protein FWF94_07505 [Oscillospiraceae bacterium]|nr:hypothetical protein [Oscillospiraceae bacterium]